MGWTRVVAGVSIWLARGRRMGDEQLNFTEEEAQPWADDPQNQAPKADAVGSIIVVCLVLVVLLVAVIAAKSSGRSTSDGGQTNIGVLFVR